MSEEERKKILYGQINCLMKLRDTLWYNPNDYFSKGEEVFDVYEKNEFAGIINYIKDQYNEITKQKENEINLKKEIRKQDELIEKLSRKLNEKTKRKIYIRRKKQ